MIQRMLQIICRHAGALVAHETGRMVLACPDCGYRSPGWDLHPERPLNVNYEREPQVLTATASVGARARAVGGKQRKSTPRGSLRLVAAGAEPSKRKQKRPSSNQAADSASVSQVSGNTDGTSATKPCAARRRRDDAAELMVH